MKDERFPPVDFPGAPLFVLHFVWSLTDGEPGRRNSLYTSRWQIYVGALQFCDRVLVLNAEGPKFNFWEPLRGRLRKTRLKPVGSEQSVPTILCWIDQGSGLAHSSSVGSYILNEEKHSKLLVHVLCWKREPKNDSTQIQMLISNPADFCFRAIAFMSKRDVLSSALCRRYALRPPARVLCLLKPCSPPLLDSYSIFDGNGALPSSWSQALF